MMMSQDRKLLHTGMYDLGKQKKYAIIIT